MSKRTPSVGLSSADRPAFVGRPSRQRSAVSNGTRLLPEGVNGGAWARRVMDLIALHEDDIGDPRLLSEAQRSLCRRCAVLEVELERMEADMAAASPDKPVDIDTYQRAVNTLGRALDRIGIERKPRSTGRNPLADHFSRPTGG